MSSKTIVSIHGQTMENRKESCKDKMSIILEEINDRVGYELAENILTESRKSWTIDNERKMNKLSPEEKTRIMGNSLL